MEKYWSIIKIDSNKYKSFIVNGFHYEHPFNFTSENIGLCEISPGYWERNDIEKLIKGKLEYEINGNMLKIISKKSYFDTFLKTIGMNEYGKWFFIQIPPEPNKIILNFSFEDISAMERPWNYPVPFNKEILLENDCFLWVSGMINNEKIRHPLQQFNVDILLIPR